MGTSNLLFMVWPIFWVVIAREGFDYLFAHDAIWEIMEGNSVVGETNKVVKIISYTVEEINTIGWMTLDNIAVDDGSILGDQNYYCLLTMPVISGLQEEKVEKVDDSCQGIAKKLGEVNHLTMKSITRNFLVK